MKVDNRVILQQIGIWNVGAISGGRVIGRESGITLPVSNGYSVEVDLASDDSYTVKRVFSRSGKRTEYVLQGIYCENVGEIAYQASCFRNREFGQKVSA